MLAVSNPSFTRGDAIGLLCGGLVALVIGTVLTFDLWSVRTRWYRSARRFGEKMGRNWRTGNYEWFYKAAGPIALLWGLVAVVSGVYELWVLR